MNPELGGEYGGSSEKSCWIEATYLESLITRHKLCKMNTIAIHVTLSKCSLVAGAWTEKKKCIMVDLFLNWQMIISTLRIQKLNIGRLGGFEKIEFENFTL